MSRVQKKKLRHESLETRSMMTGNVTAAVNNGSLIVNGDTADNGITITQTGTGTYVVTGDATTTINSQALLTPATLTGVTKSFKLDMGSGNDVTTIQNLTIPKNLDFEGRSGNDTLVLTNVKIGNNAKIDGGSGNDTITLQRDLNTTGPVSGVKVGRMLAIDGGDNFDTVTIRNTTGKYLVINSRRGNDSIHKSSLSFKATLQTSSNFSPQVADTVFNAWTNALG
jgi:hypothetical protein